MSRPFDAIIVGAGQAGPPLACRLTGAGMTVALIERKLVGGTCVNAGCKPTKTLVASARAAQVVRRAPGMASILRRPRSTWAACGGGCAASSRTHGALSRIGLAGWTT